MKLNPPPRAVLGVVQVPTDFNMDMEAGVLIKCFPRVELRMQKLKAQSMLCSAAAFNDGGPERIAPEWWRNLSAEEPSAGLDDHTRDYYMVENHAGQRFWLYRQGLYDRPKRGSTDSEAATPPAWFLQGVMA